MESSLEKTEQIIEEEEVIEVQEEQLLEVMEDNIEKTVDMLEVQSENIHIEETELEIESFDEPNESSDDEESVIQSTEDFQEPIHIVELEKEDLQPEILPENLQGAEWDKIPENEWDFEYEPLVSPYQTHRPSDAEPEPSESAKTAEWLQLLRDTRGPKLLSGLKDRLGYIGETMKLVLALDGGAIRVEWIKDSQPLPKSSRISTTTSTGLYTLIITDVEKSDSGEYTAFVYQGKEKVMESFCSVKILPAQKERREKPFIVRIRGK